MAKAAEYRDGIFAAMYAIALFAGLRYGEIIRLTWDYVRLDEKTPIIRVGRGEDPVYTDESVPQSNQPGKTEEAPHPTGYVLKGRKLTVQMSDGTTCIEHRIERDGTEAGEVVRVERNSLTLNNGENC
ncbi:MAG: hypothetical protein K0R17_3097 [Rariglobus sp.]|nr:hypothetical protein [Rariglobus sp.]